MKRMSMCDHLPKLVWEKILHQDSDSISATVRHQFLGFMMMDSNVCSIRSHLCRMKDKEDEDLIDISIKQVDWLNQIEMSKVYHCDYLLLCNVVWNPYLTQNRWIRKPYLFLASITILNSFSLLSLLFYYYSSLIRMVF
ncbi:unnamed protein product [Arabidopsis halleri]